MKISRSGALRNHGKTQLVNAAPTVSWDQHESVVRIDFRNIPSENGSHHYQVAMSLGEVNSLLSCLSQAASTSSSALFSKELASSARELSRLNLVASGVKLGES